MKTKQLQIKWTISKARDSYGYNVVTLYDHNEKFRANGGGYDMLGTVLGKWIQKNYMERLKELKPYNLDPEENYNKKNYGLFDYGHGLRMDGACGIECMIDIAKKIGLSIKKLYDHKYTTTTGFYIVDERSA